MTGLCDDPLMTAAMPCTSGVSWLIEIVQHEDQMLIDLYARSVSGSTCVTTPPDRYSRTANGAIWRRRMSRRPTSPA